MAIRNIRKSGDPILKKKSRAVTVFDNKLHQLLDDMYDTMTNADGVGLAAVQVGILRRVVVIDVGEGRTELINPVLAQQSEEQIDASEGCLSFPGQWGLVKRPRFVTVEAQNRHGDLFSVTGEGLLARALCHEIDHTNGVVFTDLASRMLTSEELEEEDAEDE